MSDTDTPTPAAPLDVWLKFDAPGDEEPSHEANTYRQHAPDIADGYVVEWSNTAVGQITRRWFPTYDAAAAWLTAAGYTDFSS